MNSKYLEKPFSELCAISEDEKNFQSAIEWHIPETDVRQYIQNYGKGKSINSNTFSIGSSHISFFFRIQPQKYTILQNWDESIGYSNIADLCIVFSRKLPESAWIKGEIYLKDMFGDRKTFSVSAKTFDKSMEFRKFCETSDLSKRLHSSTGVILHCCIKISMKEIKCVLDKEKVTYSKERNYTSCKDTFKCDSFSDISISIDNHMFLTHKALLAQIPYFQELFDNNQSVKSFELSNIEQPVFNHLLTFLYSGNISRLNFELACKLYIVASDLKIQDLKSLCSSYLGANLTETNVVIVLKLSHACEDFALKMECFKFIKNSDVDTLTAKSIVL